MASQFGGGLDARIDQNIGAMRELIAKVGITDVSGMDDSAKDAAYYVKLLENNLVPGPENETRRNWFRSVMPDPHRVDKHVNDQEILYDGRRSSLIHELENDDREASRLFVPHMTQKTFVNKYMLFEEGIRFRDEIMGKLKDSMKLLENDREIKETDVNRLTNADNAVWATTGRKVFGKYLDAHAYMWDEMDRLHTNYEHSNPLELGDPPRKFPPTGRYANLQDNPRRADVVRALGDTHPGWGK